MHNYTIRYFIRETADLGVEFEGHPCFNFKAPFKNGAFLSGQDLEDAIQAMYPYTIEEMAALAPQLTGGEDIQAKVAILTSS
jgi:hypothetical protein